jgi:hypothetical protein
MIDPWADFNDWRFKEQEKRLGQIQHWRNTGCCTECGNKLLGEVDALDDDGVVFWGGAPHEPGDRVCFWCAADWPGVNGWYAGAPPAAEGIG